MWRSIHIGSIITLLLVAHIGPAQTIDSLKAKLRSDSKPTQQIALSLNIGREYLYEDNDSALRYGLQALQLADKHNNSENLRPIYRHIGSCYDELMDYDLSIEYFQKALDHSTEKNESYHIAKVHGELANIYLWKSEFTTALHHYETAIDILDSIGRLNSASMIYNNMGILFEVQSNKEEALKYYLLSLALDEMSDNQKVLAASYRNIGLLYSQMQQYDSALVYGQKAVELDEKLGNNRSMGLSVNFLGEIHMQRGELAQAEKMLMRGVELLEPTENISSLMHAYNVLADIYTQTDRVDMAIAYSHKSEVLANRADAKMELVTAYDRLAKSYSLSGDFKKAYTYSNLGRQLKDTLLNEEQSRQIADMKEKYDTERKERENKILGLTMEQQKSSIKQQQIAIAATGVGLVLLIGLALLLFRGNRIKQRANVLLAEQRDQITEQKKDITDSIEYASRIQNTILHDVEDIRKAIPECFIYFLPREIVSGDFYWFHQSDTHTFLAACDCTGHGVPGAFVSMVCSNALSQAVLEKGITEPGHILQDVHYSVLAAFTKEGAKGTANDGMDCGLLVLNRSTNELMFSGAINPLVHLSDGKEPKRYVPDHTPIGGWTDPDHLFKSFTVEAKRGDMLYMFSDGYADQFGGDSDKKLMMRNFLDILSDISVLPTVEQERELNQRFLDWKGATEQIDDVCVIGIRV